MAEITFERGREMTYPNIYPMLTFTPIFGRNGDFVWIEEVRGAWPEHGSEFVFVRSAVHDQRVDRLKEENGKLRELVRHRVDEQLYTCGDCWGGLCENCDCWLSEHVDELQELGIETEV